MGAPDAFQGAVAEGEIELADETAGAEGGDLLPQSDDLLDKIGLTVSDALLAASILHLPELVWRHFTTRNGGVLTDHAH